MSALAVCSPATVATCGVEIRVVFAGHLAMHTTRRDFRFIAAREGENRPFRGFIYGYTDEPEQWFHDRIRAVLTQRWSSADWTMSTKSPSSAYDWKRKDAASASNSTMRS